MTRDQLDYERASARYAVALDGLNRARHVLELAEAELDEADKGLVALEAYPGIPAYTVRHLPFDRARRQHIERGHVGAFRRCNYQACQQALAEDAAGITP